ncbi:MAG: tetratricopeptide repeat protein, partial [Hyphomicrobiales bacterium]|nr:tetratricopeptide repeat protein [Hyphomicrobiales bacterium]
MAFFASVRCAIAILALVIFAGGPCSAQDQPPPELEALNDKVIELYQAGKYAEATPIAQRALAIAEKAPGPDHPDTGARLNNLALLYQAQGRLAEAEPLYKRALAIADKALGPDHPNVGTM